MPTNGGKATYFLARHSFILELSIELAEFYEGWYCSTSLLEHIGPKFNLLIRNK
jgi:hypothetical protein